jgi:ORF6N domain-containing protein
VLRGQRVMLSTDLAPLYDVEIRALIQAVKRNRMRFPPDFVFQLTLREWANLKSQSVISSWGGARRAPPHAFTEEGVAMLSSVLHSRRAARVNVEIMRAFVRLRRVAASHVQLSRALRDLERKCDARFTIVFDAIREILQSPEPPRRRIGFRA